MGEFCLFVFVVICFVVIELEMRTLLLVFCAATSSVAAPTDTGSNIALTGSSDVWASLVANVAPLLILVGEKHVKSYFKSISQKSQLALYAVSPIGLVTAIVTMVRLGNSPLMKRLIGRQFESRAEVLADVSSISGGNVGFELRGPRCILEQTINSNPRDEAKFWVQGRRSGTGIDGIEFAADVGAILNRVSKGWLGAVGRLGPLERVENRYLKALAIWEWRLESRFRDLGGCPYEEDSPTISSHPNSVRSGDPRNVHPSGLDEQGAMPAETLDIPRNCQAVVLIVFDASGEGARDVARSHAAQALNSRSKNHPDAGDEGTGCSSRALAYLSWPDVSEQLTTNANVQSGKMRVCRDMAALTCLSINIALTVLNWTFQHNKLTTSLISLGLAGSTLTSFWAAVLVSRSTSQESVCLKAIRPFRAGFLSSNHPRGVGLAYSPTQVVMSVERDKTSQYLALEVHDLVTPGSVLVAVLAFVVLYLGLRAAEWWVPFAMLGNVAFGASMRAILTINASLISSDWDKSCGATWSPNPLSSSDLLWLLHIWQDLQLGGEQPSLAELRGKTKQSRLKSQAVRSTLGNVEVGPGLLNKFRHWLPTGNSVVPGSRKTSSLTQLPHRTSWRKLPYGVSESKNHWTVLSACSERAGNNFLERSVIEPPSQFIHVAIAVTNEIVSRGLVTLESLSCSHSREGISKAGPPTAGVHFIRSEFVSLGGIWQQPLEVAVSRTQETFLDPAAAICTCLRAWAVQALLENKPVSKLSTFNLVPKIEGGETARNEFVLRLHESMESIDNIPIKDFWNGEAQNSDISSYPTELDAVAAHRLAEAFWSPRWMLWMAVRIVLALYGEEGAQSAMIQQMGDEQHLRTQTHGREAVRKEQILGYVDFLEAGGLLLPKDGTFSSINTLQEGCDSIENEPSSTNRKDAGKSQWGRHHPLKSSNCHDTSGGLAGLPASPPQAAGYMSFG